MKRSPRDMAWILLLAAVASMGIRALSEKTRTAQAIDGADPIVAGKHVWRDGVFTSEVTWEAIV